MICGLDILPNAVFIDTKILFYEECKINEK
jgi:hypothetical protein